ncbi:unnamed protein product [Prorocentrum cordatum]|uniref:Uncharacterized protein n=1 Tax=Prorocentrum cordatum TaxID=2364126 RepID=A0ABN9W8U2_9DINO|nr:unnamed protein product [Polarella glacialis]
MAATVPVHPWSSWSVPPFSVEWNPYGTISKSRRRALRRLHLAVGRQAALDFGLVVVEPWRDLSWTSGQAADCLQGHAPACENGAVAAGVLWAPDPDAFSYSTEVAAAAVIEPDFFSSSAGIRASACDKAEAEQDDQFPVPPPLPAAIFASAAAEEALSDEAELDAATVAPDPASETVTNTDEDAHIVEVEKQMNSWARKRSASRLFLRMRRRLDSTVSHKVAADSVDKAMFKPDDRATSLRQCWQDMCGTRWESRKSDIESSAVPADFLQQLGQCSVNGPAVVPAPPTAAPSECPQS